MNKCIRCGTPLYNQVFCPNCGQRNDVNATNVPTLPSSNPPYQPNTSYGAREGNPYVQNPYAGPPPSPPPPSRSNQRRLGIWVLIIVIVVVAIYGGVWGVISATKVTNIMPQVTATAQATIIATATSAVENPYTHSGTLFFSDPLSDNSLGNGWNVGTSQYGTCAFTGEAYHVSTPSNKSGISCLAAPDFSNFVLEVQMTIIKGDSGGIVFRYDHDGVHNAHYSFHIGQDGTYSLTIGQNTTLSQTLFHNTLSSAIHKGLGQTNVIAVVAQGSMITLYVNNQLVAHVIDSTYTHGQVGLTAAADLINGQPTEVVYNNAKLWTL